MHKASCNSKHGSYSKYMEVCNDVISIMKESSDELARTIPVSPSTIKRKIKPRVYYGWRSFNITSVTDC